MLPSLYASELPSPSRQNAYVPFGSAGEADVKLDPLILGGTEGYYGPILTEQLKNGRTGSYGSIL